MSLVNPSKVKDAPVPSNIKTVVEEQSIDQYGRRNWQVKQVIEEPEEEDEDDEEDLDIGPRQTKPLIKRNKDLDLDSYVGKSHTIAADLPKQQTSVYYCQLCEASCSDSQTWLDHLNGKKHNRLLGMSMKVERVGVDRIKEKFQSLKKQSLKPIQDFQEFEQKFDEKYKENKKIAKQKEKLKQKNLQELAAFQATLIQEDENNQIEKKTQIKQLEQDQGQQQVDVNQVSSIQEQKQQQQVNNDKNEESSIQPIQSIIQDNLQVVTKSDDKDQELSKKEAEPKNKINNKKREKIDDEESEEDEEIKMMKLMGLPVNFGGKNRKK